MRSTRFGRVIGLLLLFLFIIESADAQYRRRRPRYNRRHNSTVQFLHAAGFTYLVASASNTTTSLPAATYWPRVAYLSSSELSFSLDAPVSLQFQVGQSSSFGGSSSEVSVELPICLNVNFGHGASRNARSGFGGFAGLGYGYNSTTVLSETGPSSFEASLSIQGLYLQGGARAEIGRWSTGLSFYSILGSENRGVYGGRVFIAF